MKNKKGFTLIELLAVIVILAIIALIATPLIMNIINDARKGAFEDSSYAIINAAEQGYAKGLIKELETSITEYEYNEGVRTLKQGSVEVNYKGSSPESGTLLINEEGEVAIAFYSNGWCITKSYGEIKITTEAKSKEDCIITEEVPEVEEMEVVFGTNGNNNWSKVVSTIVTITSSNVDEESLKYYWSTSADTPEDILFTNTFINGDTITTPTSVSGDYYLWVLVKDKAGNITKSNTDVFKLDNIAPELTIPSNSSISIAEVASFDIMAGVSASDNSGETPTITTSGTISLLSGSYIITYTALDSAGNSTTKSVTVLVEGEANAPVLHSNMIPVVYDEIDGRWEKANTSSTWYDYKNQMWANVVLVNTNATSGVTGSKSRSQYKSAAAGTAIIEKDVLAYFVWIPRYEYETITSTPATEIKVNFIPKTQTTTTTNYIIHQAFWFDYDNDGIKDTNEHLAGIWVGKFETSTETTSTCYTSPSTSNCLDVNPLIKPNVSSLRYQTVSIQFTTIQKIKSEIYGITNGDSHTMKNTEWGAVAYLSQSKYGKYGNSMYTGINKEIYQNRSSTYITGNSNGTPSQSALNTQCTYDDVTDRGGGKGACGAGASTTGTIYGVYDMSGGAYEYVMGAMYNSGNTSIMVSDSGFISGTSGIDATSFAKYLDKYNYSGGSSDYTRAIIGDATIETRGWYSDGGSFVSGGTSSSWFIRGGYRLGSVSAGIFEFIGHTGGAMKTGTYDIGMRAVYVNS